MAINLSPESSTVHVYAPSISRLQGDAWAAWNESYHTPERELYQTLGRALYDQDVHERVTALFARSDEQNARLDALLAQRDGKAKRARRPAPRKH